MHAVSLLAFGFESLPMLGWLAAAPWLIHLLRRRKYRQTAWAAMDFLMAAMKRRTRRFCSARSVDRSFAGIGV